MYRKNGQLMPSYVNAPKNTKRCSTCKQFVALTSYNKHASRRDGLQTHCRSCSAVSVSNINALQWDSSSKYHAAAKERNARRTPGNPQYGAAKAAVHRRRARKRNAAVSWSDRAIERHIFQQAEELTQTTGIRHEVDHEHPLAGKLVCGFNVHTNLQVITKAENASKSNRFTCFSQAPGEEPVLFKHIDQTLMMLDNARALQALRRTDSYYDDQFTCSLFA